MAIALDTSTDGGLVNPGTSLTYSHTCTGSNLILFVSAFGDNTDKITGVTYNAVAMTLVDKILGYFLDRWVYLFVLVAPATGAHNVVVSASASIAIASHAVSYTGAAQTGQPDNKNKVSGTTTTQALAVTTIADNCWVVGAFRSGTTGGTAGTGSTQRKASSGLYTADSNSAKTPAGSYSMTYNNGVDGWGVVVASFAPTVAALTKNQNVNQAVKRASYY